MGDDAATFAPGRTVHDEATRDTTLGVHVVDLPTRCLPAPSLIDMTFYWPETDRWEGLDYQACVE